MTVLCAQCQNPNRDRAMFCIGCAGKLPAFAATGPSALQALQPLSPPSRRTPDRTRPDTAPSATGRVEASSVAPRGLWIALLLLGAIVLALSAWISVGPERAAAPGMASAAPPPRPAAAAATDAAAASRVPFEAALAPGESTVPATPAPSSMPVLLATPAPATPPPAMTRVEPPAPSPPPSRRVASRSSEAVARAATDPRTGCEHLFFVLAARCEAKHCEQAAYTRHPRCSVVREQGRRDEARRNLTQ